MRVVGRLEAVEAKCEEWIEVVYNNFEFLRFQGYDEA
jgi:hypothetical protein